MYPQSQGVRTGSVASRLPEVLDNLKSEFEQLNHEASVYKAQRDENERKCKLPHYNARTLKLAQRLPISFAQIRFGGHKYPNNRPKLIVL
jgi:hypothetical protein